MLKSPRLPQQGRGRKSALALSIATLCLIGAAPTTAPIVRIGPPAEWPAFHGGAELRGVAETLPPKPLALRWTFRAGADEQSSISGGAAIERGVVYVGDDAGGVHAVDLATGKARWLYKADAGFETTPLVLGGRVMLGDVEGTFHCISADTGKKLWTFDAGSAIHSSANAVGDPKDARILFGSEGAVYCLKAADGSKVWSRETSAPVYGTPAIGYGAAFVSGCDQHLHAMKLEDGADKFSADLGQVCPGAPALLDDRIVVGTDGGQVVCLSSDGARTLWTYSKIGEQAMVFSSPAVDHGVVVVGARDRKVHGIDLATGKRKWVFPTHADVDSSPVISGGRVYIGSKDKNLYVLDLATGALQGQFSAGRAITGSPAVGEGVIVVGDNAGNLYCLEPR